MAQPIKKTTATVSLSGTLVEKMHACAAAGFDGIELFEPDLSPDEIKELLLQTAIYCGVPDANTAFRIARRALNEGRAEQDQHQKED